MKIDSHSPNSFKEIDSEGCRVVRAEPESPRRARARSASSQSDDLDVPSRSFKVRHPPPINRRKRPAAQSLHQALRPRVRSSKPSFDATIAKLCVVDVFPKHNPAADQQLSSYGNGCYRFATSLANSFIKLLQLWIESHCHMSSFSQKEPQQARAGFAYSEKAFSFGA